MNTDLSLDIKNAERTLQRLRDKQNAQTYEVPPLLKKAKELVKHNYSDTYIQSVLYASRTPNIGINEIVSIIETARQECNAVTN